MASSFDCKCEKETKSTANANFKLNKNILV